MITGSRHLLLILTACVPLGATAQPAWPPERSAAYDRLDLFVGEWTTSDLPPEMTFTETCEWVALRRHVVCRARRERPGRVNEGISILTYIEADSTYRHYAFGSRGDPATLTGRAEGDGLVFLDETGSGETRSRLRITITPNSEGFDFLVEEAVGDGPWTEAGREVYLRLD